MPASNFVFPIRYVSEGISVQTTSRELSALGVAVRSLAPPHVGARVSLALYLPNTAAPEVAIGRVARSKAGAVAEAGFWADFMVVDPQARMRISSLLNDHSLGGQHRAFPRFPVHVQLQVRKAGGFVSEKALNLSRSGVFVRTETPPPIHTAVEVELQLPNGAPSITTAGVVVHRQEPGSDKVAGVGIQFVDASDNFREWVDRYTSSLVKH
jgi:type IV pilus assembly protein PilZ